MAVAADPTPTAPPSGAAGTPPPGGQTGSPPPGGQPTGSQGGAAPSGGQQSVPPPTGGQSQPPQPSGNGQPSGGGQPSNGSLGQPPIPPTSAMTPPALKDANFFTNASSATGGVPAVQTSGGGLYIPAGSGGSVPQGAIKLGDGGLYVPPSGSGSGTGDQPKVPLAGGGTYYPPMTGSSSTSFTPPSDAIPLLSGGYVVAPGGDKTPSQLPSWTPPADFTPPSGFVTPTGYQGPPPTQTSGGFKYSLGSNGSVVVPKDYQPDFGTNGSDHLVASSKVASYIDAGAGNDTINAKNGHVDTINCGAGTDTVTADKGDKLIGCEHVTISSS